MFIEFFENGSSTGSSILLNHAKEIIFGGDENGDVRMFGPWTTGVIPDGHLEMEISFKTPRPFSLGT
jgi:hypothetical protein